MSSCPGWAYLVRWAELLRTEAHSPNSGQTPRPWTEDMPLSPGCWRVFPEAGPEAGVAGVLAPLWKPFGLLYLAWGWQTGTLTAWCC